MRQSQVLFEVCVREEEVVDGGPVLAQQCPIRLQSGGEQGFEVGFA